MRLFRRIMAVIGIVLLLGMVFLTLFFAVTGSRYFMASLFAMIVIPVFIYGYMIILRALSSRQKDRINRILEESGADAEQHHAEQHHDEEKHCNGEETSGEE